jgi:hypothetical protein
MKHIQIYENFQEGPMRKPEGFFSRLAKGAKDALGIETAKDREGLETIYRLIAMNEPYGFVQSAREIKPGVIVAWLNDQSVTVDTETSEILWKGKALDLNDIQAEAYTLYQKLRPFTIKVELTSGRREDATDSLAR